MNKPNSTPTRQAAQQKNQVQIGVGLAVLGVIFLLDNLRIFDARAILPFWPVVLIVVGALKLSQSSSERPSERLFAGALILIGSLLTLRHLGIFDFRWRDWWPLLLIGAGVMVIFKGRLRPQAMSATDGPPESSAGPASGRGISVSAILSGHQSQLDDQNFAGGELTVFMGSADLDLSRAAIPEGGTAILTVLVVMGELKLKIPTDWSVSVQASPVLGSIEDKTRAASPPGPPSRRLVVRGDVALAGVEIYN